VSEAKAAVPADDLDARIAALSGALAELSAALADLSAKRRVISERWDEVFTVRQDLQRGRERLIPPAPTEGTNSSHA